MTHMHRLSHIRSVVILFIAAFSPILSYAEKQSTYSVSEALNQEALKLYKSGDLEGAIGVWRHAAREDKLAGTDHTANAEVLNNLGYAYYKLGLKRDNLDDLDKARHYLEATIKVDASRWVAYLNLGDLCRELELPDAALYSYQHLLRLKPDYVHAKKIHDAIDALTKHQNVSWKTHHGNGFTLRYPQRYATRSAYEGTEVVPPDPPTNCQPHCPAFLIVGSKSNKSMSLEDWIVDRWRLEGLSRFYLFRMTPQQSHWQIDCIEPFITSQGISGYKLHRWVQSVGIRYYYLYDKRNALVVELQSIGTGKVCEDHLPEDWILRQVIDSVSFADTPAAGKKALFNIYGADEQAMHAILQSIIAIDTTQTLREQLEQISRALSERAFSGLPIRIKAIREQNGREIAQIELMEYEGTEPSPSSKVWVSRYFEGMAGREMTAQILLRSFLQTDHRGEWIDGVEFLYQGRPIREQEFEHLFNLQGIHYRAQKR